MDKSSRIFIRVSEMSMEKKCICLEDNKLTQAMCPVHTPLPEDTGSDTNVGTKPSQPSTEEWDCHGDLEKKIFEIADRPNNGKWSVMKACYDIKTLLQEEREKYEKEQALDFLTDGYKTTNVWYSKTKKEAQAEVLRDLIQFSEPYEKAKWINPISLKQLKKYADRKGIRLESEEV